MNEHPPLRRSTLDFSNYQVGTEFTYLNVLMKVTSHICPHIQGEEAMQCDFVDDTGLIQSLTFKGDILKYILSHTPSRIKKVGFTQ